MTLSFAKLPTPLVALKLAPIKLLASTDDEIDAICAGLTQNAAKCRYLRRMGLPVQRRPNGRPLIRRSDWETRNPASAAANGPRWKKQA